MYIYIFKNLIKIFIYKIFPKNSSVNFHLFIIKKKKLIKLKKVYRSK